MVKPYTDTIAWQTSSKKIFVRVFDATIDEELLEWHQDKHDRCVKVVKGTGWQLQFDNQLPQALSPSGIYLIDKDTHHRILKGKDDLVLLIIENTIIT